MANQNTTDAGNKALREQRAAVYDQAKAVLDRGLKTEQDVAAYERLEAELDAIDAQLDGPRDDLPAHLAGKALFTHASRHDDARFNTNPDRARLDDDRTPSASPLTRDELKALHRVEVHQELEAGKDLPAGARDMAPQARNYARAQAAGIHNRAASEGRPMRDSEQRSYNRWVEAQNMAQDIINVNKAQPVPAGIFGGAPEVGNYAPGQPLMKGQSAHGYAAARGLIEHDDLSLSKCLRGALTGDWRGAEREMNAMSGATTTGGGILIPTSLSSRIIDKARAKTRVLESGAQVVAMESRKVTVPRWTQDPNMAWRGENDIVAESDAALAGVDLDAKNLATVVRVARELVEDTDIEDALIDAFAADLALKIDAAALYGTGTDQPLGVKNTTSVTKTALAANGATPTWDALIDSVGRLRDAGEEPNAQIMADRTARSLAKLKATDGSYLAPPTYLDGVTRRPTSALPVNLTQGTSNAASDVFTADWSQLIVGIRINLVVEVLKERYMTNDLGTPPAGGQYGFLAWWRGDIAVGRPSAFDVVTGVIA